MENKDGKVEYITKKDLSEQTQIILSAMDKRFGVVDTKLNEVRKELRETKDELKRDINNVQTLIDGYVKAQEDFRQEFVIMKEEMKQMKKIIKEKFGLEIEAAG